MKRGGSSAVRTRGSGGEERGVDGMYCVGGLCEEVGVFLSVLRLELSAVAPRSRPVEEDGVGVGCRGVRYIWILFCRNDLTDPATDPATDSASGEPWYEPCETELFAELMAPRWDFPTGAAANDDVSVGDRGRIDRRPRIFSSGTCRRCCCPPCSREGEDLGTTFAETSFSTAAPPRRF